MRYELTDYERSAIRRFLPNKARGVPRVNDRRVLVSFGSYDQARHGVICRKALVPTRPVIIALFAGKRPVCGTR